jgi:hypothetical protein
VRRIHRGAQKIVKDWLRKFINTNIEIWQYIFDWWRLYWQRKINLRKKSPKLYIYIYIYKESIRFCWKINWVYEGFDCNENLFLSQFRL